MKKFYSSVIAAMICAPAMMAQNHNVEVNFTQEFIEAGQSDPIWLEATFSPNYVPSTSESIPGSFVVDGKDLSNLKTVENNLATGLIDGKTLEVTLGEDGLAYVTCPSEAYISGTLTPVTKGDIRLRIAFGGSPNRPGDTHDLYVHDMTGIYATVSAPAGTAINGYVVAASCATFSTSDHPTGDPENGKYFHTVFYNFAQLTANNTPTDLQTEGEPTGALNLFTYRRPTKGLDKCDAEGFPCKYFDVVFRDIRPGEKVGLCNYQTLHEGVTPKPYSGGVSVATIEAENADAPVEYFNLQGMRIENPANGLYIKRQGNVVKKVLVK